jgi:hypothetical protein
LEEQSLYLDEALSMNKVQCCFAIAWKHLLQIHS